MIKMYNPSDIKGFLSDLYGIYEGVFFTDGVCLGYDVRYTPTFHGLCISKEYFVEQVLNDKGELLERKFPSEEYKECFTKFIFYDQGEWIFDESDYENKGVVL